MGLQKADRILSLNGKPVSSFSQFTYEVGRSTDMFTCAQTHADTVKALPESSVTAAVSTRIKLDWI